MHWHKLQLVGRQLIGNNTPHDFDDLVSYFDSTCVSGTFRAIASPGQTVILRNIPRRYPLATWNMNETTLHDGSRTNNLYESWNNAFLQLVGHKHPSIWTCVEALLKDSMLSSLALQNHNIGIPLAKRVKRKKIKRPIENTL